MKQHTGIHTTGVRAARSNSWYATNQCCTPTQSNTNQAAQQRPDCSAAGNPSEAQQCKQCKPCKPGNVYRSLRHLVINDRGAVTAEYAIVILAAVTFAGLLVAIMSSGEVRAALVRLVEQALNAGS